MNKIVDKLFSQALDKAVPETWTTLDQDQLARLKDQFAELIIKETMQVVANQLPSNQYLDVAEAVITHFGVEE
jgi:hypothetical protein